MKKRSKVFLIVSAIIFGVGLILCLIGALVASGDGEQIYSTKIGEDRGYVYDFGDESADKIKINVTDANVNVYGNSERSYIEVLNFNENLCSYSANNAMVSFREATEVDDITGVWESGLSFKGLRYILRPVPADKQKTVNIYLAEKEHIKAFDIKLGRGTVIVSGISVLADYDVTIESGKVIFRDISTESGIDISASGDISTDIIFENVVSDFISIDAKRSKITADKLTTADCELNVTTGSAKFELVPKTEHYTVEIATKGKLTVDGAIFPDRYSYSSLEDSGKDEPDEEVTVSSLKIAGDDFTVNLTTPAKTEEVTE